MFDGARVAFHRGFHEQGIAVALVAAALSRVFRDRAGSLRLKG